MTKHELIQFEDRVRELWELGELPSLLHLCGGQEDDLIQIFQDIRPQDWIFTSHRSHYHNLLKGMPPDELLEHIRSDRSMFVFSRKLRIYQSAILGGCCGIATGVAYAIKQSGEDAHVYCFLGDGAADNGHLWEAAIYATGHELPVTFIIENNNRQVDTSIADRRGPKHFLSRFFAPCVQEFHYEPRWPHAGSGCSHKIQFQRNHPL